MPTLLAVFAERGRKNWPEAPAPMASGDTSAHHSESNQLNGDGKRAHYDFGSGTSYSPGRLPALRAKGPAPAKPVEITTPQRFAAKAVEIFGTPSYREEHYGPKQEPDPAASFGWPSSAGGTFGSSIHGQGGPAPPTAAETDAAVTDATDDAHLPPVPPMRSFRVSSSFRGSFRASFRRTVAQVADDAGLGEAADALGDLGSGDRRPWRTAAAREKETKEGTRRAAANDKRRLVLAWLPGATAALVTWTSLTTGGVTDIAAGKHVAIEEGIQGAALAERRFRRARDAAESAATRGAVMEGLAGRHAADIGTRARVTGDAPPTREATPPGDHHASESRHSVAGHRRRSSVVRLGEPIPVEAVVVLSDGRQGFGRGPTTKVVRRSSVAGSQETHHGAVTGVET